MDPESATDDRVLTLPGLNSKNSKVSGVQFAGYAAVGTGDESLFYWFVGDDDYASRPTVIWTNGGPGSSSFWGFFLENGPYEVESALEPTVVPRSYGWNEFANYMIFEHPLSVTLSFAENDADVPKSVEEGIDQYYRALQSFLAKHPEIAKNPIVLAGESYAGTYLPLLAQAIFEGNKQKGNLAIDLRTMVLLDAWVSPKVQMEQDTAYAYGRGLISAAQKAMLDKTYRGLDPKNGLPVIDGKIQEICGCYMANLAEVGDPPFDPVLLYLNRDDVRDAIHAKKGTALTQTYSQLVSDNYAARVNESYAPLVEKLLKKTELQVLVISGLNDAKDCNFLGTGAWLDKLKGKAASRFHAADTTPWLDPQNRTIGFEQSGGQLRWLKVLNAGHLAVRDQPLIIDYILEAAGLD
jgi:vitellogenic carboxypeptidase-like protein